MELEGKWKAILIGGAVTGLASLVPILHFACCLIPFVGALIAVAIYNSAFPPPVLKNSDGVTLGAMSGLVGAAIYAVLVIPLVFILGNTIGRFVAQTIPDLADIPANVRPLVQGILNNFGSVLTVFVIFRILSQLALSLIFGILGGIAGVALFRRTTSV